MRAVSRWGSLLLAGALAVAPAIALAQQAPPPASPAPESVGPKDLQNFSLGGTVTRPADQPATAQPATRPTRPPRADTPTAASEPAQRTPTRTADASAQVQTATAQPRPQPSPKAVAPQTQPSSAAAGPFPNPSSVPQTTTLPTPLPTATSAFPAAPQPAGVAASGHGYSMLLWMLEALALVLAIGFLFWRTRGREMFATSANFDLLSAPEPAPAPQPATRPAPVPAPRAAPKPVAPPAASAVVSTGLRPQMEMNFQPLRCILEDQRVVVEFDLELVNSGSAPARAVLVEARLFNAGADQDRHILDFFANPLGTGERIAVIAPLQRLSVRTQAVAPRDQIQAYELAGRPVFVPLIAFNALYSWSGGEAQTSVSYLLGRDTKGDKLAPFRLDLGPHIFRGLASRLLPTGIRR